MRPVGQEWYCPNCPSNALTYDTKIPMHPCRGTAGLMIPLVHTSQKSEVVVNAREDYIGKEDVQFDGLGRPTMSVTTKRDKGEDCTIFAPTASISQEVLRG